MVKVLRTQHVLAVDNFAEAIAYFIDKLGFTQTFHVDGLSFLRLDSLLPAYMPSLAKCLP